MVNVMQAVRRWSFKRRMRNRLESELWEAEVAIRYNNVRMGNIQKMIDVSEGEYKALSSEVVDLANDHTVEGRNRKKEIEQEMGEVEQKMNGLKRLSNAILADSKTTEGKMAVAADRLAYLDDSWVVFS